MTQDTMHKFTLLLSKIKEYCAESDIRDPEHVEIWITLLTSAFFCNRLLFYKDFIFVKYDADMQLTNALLDADLFSDRIICYSQEDADLLASFFAHSDDEEYYIAKASFIACFDCFGTTGIPLSSVFTAESIDLGELTPQTIKVCDELIKLWEDTSFGDIEII